MFGIFIRARYLLVVALTLGGVCSWVALSGAAPAASAADTTATAPDLTTVPGSPFSTGAFDAQGASDSLSYSPNGDFLAVGNRVASSGSGGSVSMFSVSNTGALTAVTDSPFATPAGPSDVAFDPDGQYLAVANAVEMLGSAVCNSCVSMYSVGSDGALSLITGSTAAPTAIYGQVEQIAFAPDGDTLVATTPSAVVSFSVAGNGDLSVVSTITDPDNLDLPGQIAVSPDGKLVAVADLGNEGVDLYSLSGSSLTFLSSTPTGETPQGVAFSANGDLLAVANRDANTISMFTVGSGGVTPVAGSPFSDPNMADQGPLVPAFNPAGWLAVLESDTYLASYSVEADGALQEPGTGDEYAAEDPAALVFSPSGQFIDTLDTEDSTINVFAGLAPPTATIKTPTSGGTYTVGEQVPTSFSCADSTGAPGIASCTDSNGATNGTGALNTSTAGSFTYSVNAVSQDGLTGTAKITYTVSGTSTTTTSTTTSTNSTPPASTGPVTTSGSTASTTLKCSGTASQTCSFTVSATVQETVSGSKILAVAASGKKKAKRTVKTVVIGTVSVKLRGGKKEIVKLSLNKTGTALVKKYRSLKAKVEVTEGKKVLRSQRVTFKPSKRK